MAVDTLEKRLSIMAARTPWGHGMPTFEADGGVDADDRHHLLCRFAGDTDWDDPVAPEPVTVIGEEKYYVRIRESRKLFPGVRFAIARLFRPPVRA